MKYRTIYADPPWMESGGGWTWRERALPAHESEGDYSPCADGEGAGGGQRPLVPLDYK